MACSDLVEGRAVVWLYQGSREFSECDSFSSVHSAVIDQAKAVVQHFGGERCASLNIQSIAIDLRIPAASRNGRTWNGVVVIAWLSSFVRDSA